MISTKATHINHIKLPLKAAFITMEDESDSDDEAPMLVAMAGPEPPVEESLPPCPVTILSGFLGSGKTTLIQYILKDPNHGKRIAVIENEFGEGLAVENMIARDGVDPQSDSLQDFIELPNGCICCTVKDSLVETLENLVTKKKDIDYILIEASGMADPGPIASVFWLDDALESRLKLDGIVTLVDAGHVLQQLETTEEAARQIAYSDRLLINKVDCLKDEKEMEQVTAALRRLHPTAPLLTTTYSQVPDLNWILGANCFGGAARLEELESVWNNVLSSTSDGHDHNHSHDHGHHDDCHACHELQQQHRHTDAVTTLAFQKEGSISLERLNKWLAEILWPHQDETNKFLMSMLEDSSKKDHFLKKKANVMQIFRIKGIVSVIHNTTDLLDANEHEKYSKACQGNRLLDSRRYIVQAVHDLWEVHPASDNLCFAEEEARLGKVVVIGKHLPAQQLEESFQACFIG